MISCKICGYCVKDRLINHILNKHNISLEFYKNNYGEYISDEYRRSTGEKTKKNWENKEFREKTNKARNDSWTKEKKEEQSIRIKRYYKDSGALPWNNGLTKENDKRLESVGVKNKKNLTGRTKENYEYLQKHSDKIKQIWKNEKGRMKYNSMWMSEQEKREWGEKISETISRKVASGEISNKSNRFKQGVYTNKKGSFFYDSGWEKEAMEFFDDKDLEWTNKHGIRIEYEDEKGIKRKYIPDFLLSINGIEYIIEIKGWNTKEVSIKEIAAQIIYKENYKLYYSVEELKRSINEIIENTKNNKV